MPAATMSSAHRREIALRRALPRSEQDAPALRPQQAGDGGESRGLAGAVGADQSDDLALLDLQADAAQGVGAAAPHMHVFKPQHVRPFSAARDRLDDGRIGLDCGGGAGREQAALVDDDDALADAHDHLHVVLDQQRGDLEFAVQALDVRPRSAVSCGFIPAVGSSSSRRLGSVARARANSTLRWSP